MLATLCATIRGMTKRGRPRATSSIKPVGPSWEDVPLPGLAVVKQEPVYDKQGEQGRAADALERAAAATLVAADRMAVAVAAARAAGLSWDSIGAATKTQGETVRRRYG